jgi:hypothetical protein
MRRRSASSRRALLARYGVGCFGATQILFQTFEDALRCLAIRATHHDSRSFERVHGRLSHADPPPLGIGLPKLDVLKAAQARLHEESEVQGVGLIAAASPRGGRRVGLDDVDQLEIHQLLDYVVLGFVIRYLGLADQEPGSSLP